LIKALQNKASNKIKLSNFFIIMSRLQPYRNRIPTHIIKLLDVSSRITLFLVGQNGPLSFIFKDRLENKYKTTIGA